jgi:subtilisin family serine protease
MKHTKSWFTLLSLSAVFMACSSLPHADQSYVLTVKITPEATIQAVEQRFAGKVLAWLPQRKTAFVKTERMPAQADETLLHIEDNQPIQSTESILGLNQPNNLHTTNETSASIAGMSGWSTWSSGWSTWSSGWSTWSNGLDTLPPLPTSNSIAFQNIRLPQAHAIAKNYGKGVTVAVLDTGIDLSHPGFVGKLTATNLHKDFVDLDSIPSEKRGFGYGHGTAVSGLILQVAPEAKILPIRVLNENGRGNLSSLVSGLAHATSNGAKVINVSLGSLQTSLALETMITHARDMGVFVVASVGNAGRKDNSDFPAKYEDLGAVRDFLFGVGSVSNTDELSSFTNRGIDVSLYAPGERLTTFFPDNAVINATGTSFSAPLVSGALALGLSNTDTIVHAQVGSHFRTLQEKNRINWTVYNNGKTRWEHSDGRLDLEAFLLGLPGFVPLNRSSKTDFVVNGNFERGDLSGWVVERASITTDSKPFSGWVVERASITTDSKPFSGNSAVALNPDGSASARQKLSGLTPNTTYIASAWIRSSVRGQSATFGVATIGSPSVAKTVSSNYLFQNVTIEFKTGASNPYTELIFSKNGNSLVVGDLFSVVRK